MTDQTGRAELRRALRASWTLFFSTFLFSFFVNALMLTGPIYMLQVYDRVLGSRSPETLIALTLLVAFLYVIMAVLDYARGRVLARAGGRFQALLDRRVFDTGLRLATLSATRSGPDVGLRDLEAVQRLLSSPALIAVFDIPWTPVFLLAIFVFHPWLGYLAVSGGAVLIAFTGLNQLTTKHLVAEANHASVRADQFAENVVQEAELVQSLGMRGAVRDRWALLRDRSLQRTMSASDFTGTFLSGSKALRLFLQSAMLGLGAYLVLKGQMSAGAMVAGSILLGRALAPVEQAIAQWPMVLRAQAGWHRLSERLTHIPPDAARTPLPVPRAHLKVDQLTVIPPGEKQPTLRMMSFRLMPGQALGVIGPSGAGKTTLARALIGVWPVAGGKVRLDGAPIQQYHPDVLGRYFGYLPQRVSLFEGTVAENIARMSSRPDADKVVAAAKMAAAHQMILRLPNGYDTRVGPNNGRLSGGQIQRIGLARAVFGDPVVLVLDEPSSNLDAEGSAALNGAIRAMKGRGKSVIIMAHRPAAIVECDLLLLIEGGCRRAFGPRDEVLKKRVKNHVQLAKPADLTGRP